MTIVITKDLKLIMKLCDNHFTKLRNNMYNVTLRF